MQLAFSKEDDEFRDEVRTWLAENTPRERRPREGQGVRDYDLAWQRLQHDAGWAGISWPVEFGGRGLSLTQQLIWFEEYARTGMRGIDSRFVGLSHAGPTLIARATDEQRSFQRRGQAQIEIGDGAVVDEGRAAVAEPRVRCAVGV